jgi:hypothetical protein
MGPPLLGPHALGSYLALTKPLRQGLNPPDNLISRHSNGIRYIYHYAPLKMTMGPRSLEHSRV